MYSELVLGIFSALCLCQCWVCLSARFMVSFGLVTSVVHVLSIVLGLLVGLCRMLGLYKCWGNVGFVLVWCLG